MGKSKDPMRKRSRMGAETVLLGRNVAPTVRVAPVPPSPRKRWAPLEPVIPSKGTRAQRIKGARLTKAMAR